MDSVGGMLLTLGVEECTGSECSSVKLSLAAVECQFGTGASDRGWRLPRGTHRYPHNLVNYKHSTQSEASLSTKVS